MPNGLNVNNPPKAYIVILALVCITILMVTNTIEAESGLGLLGLIVGYAVGNGIAAKQDQPVEPILGHGHRDQQEDEE
jgi:hypothetical protein